LKKLLSPRSSGTRGIVYMVIPFQRGTAWEQLPPDLASICLKVELSIWECHFVPIVMELIMAELLYLQ